MKKENFIEQIEQDLLHAQQSPLYKYRQQNKYLPVIGEGSLEAEIMFVGEAPGKKEAETGKPFCGRAGKLLNLHLEKINLAREDIYITNIVKDRPPQNRDPSAEEISFYTPFLMRQIDIMQPAIIVTLGRFSSYHLLKILTGKEKRYPMLEMTGKVFLFEKGKIVPLIHPAAVIYDRKKEKLFEEGLSVLKKEL